MYASYKSLLVHIASALILMLLVAPVLAEDPATFDQRFGVVATDSSGWDGPVKPMQGPQFFEPLATAWWYNYSPRIESYEVPGLMLSWPGYRRLYMFWKADTHSATEIQDYARAAKVADPSHTIWWAMSNEPNDTGQANQAAATFAPIYLKYHKNLRIGDPTCKIMGCGLLDWQYTKWSCYQTGKSWYEEFRNAWAAIPECATYSQSINGTNYPPQDAFCVHSYHMNAQPADWRWCRDDLTACHNDLETYPETQGLKIWNTEWGDLNAPSKTQAANMMGALSLWMREQPWMDKWFLFLTHNDRYTSFHHIELFDDNGNIMPLGRAYQAISKLPANAEFYHYPFNASFDQAPVYVRPSWSDDGKIGENTSGLKFYLTNGVNYSANTMRARKFAPQKGLISKVRFNYQTNYDNTRCVLVMDTSKGESKWQVDTFGYKLDYLEIDLSDDPVEYITFGLYIKCAFTYTRPTEEWYGIVSNVMLLTSNSKAKITPALWQQSE